MTTATPQPGPSPAPAQGGAADPSMEDILASIRRILSEDEVEQASGGPPAEPHAPAGSDVLALDASMLVEEPEPEAAPPAPPPVLRAEPVLPSMHSQRPAEPPAPTPVTEEYAVNDSLLGPEATAAAASSVGSLLRTLVSERQQVAVYRGGPTIEDLVREEIRPVLKQWLDANLPPLVERLVRAEIERVVGRAIS